MKLLIKATLARLLIAPYQLSNLGLNLGPDLGPDLESRISISISNLDLDLHLHSKVYLWFDFIIFLLNVIKI